MSVQSYTPFYFFTGVYICYAIQTAEVRLKDAQERLVSYEQRMAEQTRMLAELTARSEQHSGTAQEMREHWHEVTAENRALTTRAEALEK